MSNKNTDTLITALAADLAPVRRLSQPGKRLTVWVLVAFPLSLLLGALVEGQNIMLAFDRISDPRLVAELAAILATALTAGYAALSSAQPGRSPHMWVLPVVPFIVWLGLVGESCFTLWVKIGDQINFAPEWVCVPSVMATGAVPTLVIVLMIKRGTILNAPLTAMLATLAAAALGAVGLRLFHQPDAVVLVFLWQLIATIGLFVCSGITAAYMQHRAA